ncbi:hypothetical protein [Streptomyces sp. AN091965]|uniref:hypothetical protein n=1 Tax=Streptomyces sp. AN091965 TaxID=2927803 RepID=UPI001F61C977|nr:hypothetical protein [Streptomyces sp. AN091965]MCI3928971.1 hypothetical protein [Streptomyces sp. AN091965]
MAELAAACGGHGQRWWGTRPLLAELHRIGGGNPLLTRALIEDGRGPVTGSGAGGPVDLVPGEAFEQAVTMCLYRSDTGTRNAAWALAVLGPHAAHAELAEVLGVSPRSPPGRSRAASAPGTRPNSSATCCGSGRSTEPPQCSAPPRSAARHPAPARRRAALPPVTKVYGAVGRRLAGPTPWSRAPRAPA